MKKMIQLIAIVALVSASSGYAGWWENFKNFFAPKPGLEWKKLEQANRTIRLPQNLKRDKPYELMKVGEDVYIKTNPTSPEKIKPELKGISAYDQSQHISTRPTYIFTNEINPHRKTYVTNKGSLYDFTTFKQKPKLKESEVEKAFARSQRMIGE